VGKQAGLIVLLAGMAALLAPHTAGAAGVPIMPDRIVLKSDANITGIRVTRANVDGITYKRLDGTGPTKTLSPAEVKEISWGDAGQFRRGMAMYNRATPDLEGALRLFRSLPASGPRDYWYGPLRRLMIGKCLYRLKRYDDAIPFFQDVERKYSQSMYVITAIQGLARCHNAKKDYKKAADAYAKFDPRGTYNRAGDPKPYGKMWQWRGREGMAQAYAKIAARASDAGKIYAGLVKGTGAALAKLPADLKADTKEIRGINQRALVGLVDVLKNAKKYDEAARQIEQIITKIDDPSARAKMYATLGEIRSRQAEKAPDAQKTLLRKKALIAYMRVYILYPDNKAERRKAMLGAAVVSRLLNTPDDARRAKRLCRELKAEFPGTDEGTQASRILQLMGAR